MSNANASKVVLQQEEIDQLKLAAQTSETRRARICMHASHDDHVQEMLIVLCKKTNVRIHRHPMRSESFHIVEGVVEVIFFDDEGREVERLKLGEPSTGLPFLYRLNNSLWHTVEPVTDIAVIHETVAGPFNSESSEFLETIYSATNNKIGKMEAP